MASRKIIRIDKEKCTGCGQCIVTCAEGALAIVDGKARLIKDIYCDGLGACIGECPEDALKIIEREANEFDEAEVHKRLDHNKEPGPAEAVLPCGCPGSSTMILERKKTAGADKGSYEISSELGQWPIKLQLLGPQAPFLKGSDMLLLADCVGVAHPNLHRNILAGHSVAIGCPKLDDLEAHITRLADILKGARPKSLTVVHMDVPCCRGFVVAAVKAIERSGVVIPLRRMEVDRHGEVIAEETIIPDPAEAGACACGAGRD